MADDETTNTNSWTPENSRFGLFNFLDHRSGYYTDSFPQPLIVEDTSLEETELELNYQHTAAGDQQRSDVLSGEFQKSFGVTTFELEVPYQRTSDSDDSSRGFGNIEVSVRAPLYQFVSNRGTFDTTAGVRLGGSISVDTKVNKYSEFEPAFFNDLKIGRHFTVQTVLGYSRLFGNGKHDGEEEFEYGVALSYTITREQLGIPGVRQISPLLEAQGDLGLNLGEAGSNDLLGSAGFRMDFKNIGELQPSIGLAYLFPMTSDAREEVHWGIVASFTVEF